jgi:hypothetical protein
MNIADYIEDLRDYHKQSNVQHFTINGRLLVVIISWAYMEVLRTYVLFDGEVGRELSNKYVY